MFWVFFLSKTRINQHKYTRYFIRNKHDAVLSSHGAGWGLRLLSVFVTQGGSIFLFFGACHFAKSQSRAVLLIWHTNVTFSFAFTVNTFLKREK